MAKYHKIKINRNWVEAFCTEGYEITFNGSKAKLFVEFGGDGTVLILKEGRKKAKEFHPVREWFNTFAEESYELENGNKIFISPFKDCIRFEELD